MLSLKQILFKFCQVIFSIINTSSFKGLVSLMALPITIWDCCGPCRFESVDTSVQTSGLIEFSSENYQLQNESMKTVYIRTEGCLHI